MQTERQLQRELRAKYNTPQRNGEWTQDWDQYVEIDLDSTAAVDQSSADHLELRAKFHNVGPACVCRFVHQTMGWHYGSGPARRSIRKSSNHSRSWIRYMAFSSNSPPREAIARRLERLHWLAGMDPPTWEQVRTKEDCVRAIEAFRTLRCVTKMSTGANFNPTDWGVISPWPQCHACNAEGVHCYSDSDNEPT